MFTPLLHAAGLQYSVQQHYTVNNLWKLNLTGGFNKGNEGILEIWSKSN